MDVGYGALAVALTVLAALYTVWAYRRRGVAAGLRGASLTLLVVALYLTRTLRMLGRVVDAVVDWATALVFSPAVWTGIALAGLAVLLFGASRFLDRRAPAEAAAPRAAPRAVGRGAADAPTPRQSTPRSQPAADDEFADIEAILKNRGIT